MRYFPVVALLAYSVVIAAATDIQQAEIAVMDRMAEDGHSDDYGIMEHFTLRGSFSDAPLAYVFLLDPAGFVITSCDDRITPVIAYSYMDGCFLPNDDEGPMLKLVKLDMERRMENAGSLPRWYVQRNRQAWKDLNDYPAALPAVEYWPPAGSTPTEGWLEENWTQGSPYNQFCPLDLIAGSRSVAGCPAVAMGSILFYRRETNGTRFDDGDDYYHNYHEYYFIDDDHVAHDFPSWPELNSLLDTVEVHWSQGSSTYQDRAAVVYASGAACKQVYTASVSGTFGIGQAYDAYVRFGFDGCQLLDDSSDSLYQIMSQNMMDGMPVHLGIVDSIPQYGHNVVVDGYNTDDYFHINFGWGGSSNGWYSFPLQGMPYGMNIIEGVVVDIGEPLQGVPGGSAAIPGSLRIRSVTNPVRDQVRAGILSQAEGEAEALVLSMDGRLVLHEDITLNEGSNHLSVSTADLRSGVYILRVVMESDCDSALFSVIR